TLLPDYLLSAHGDRVLMANGVEGRYPFLDRRLVEYAAQLSPARKLALRTEKYLLRRAASRWLDRDIRSVPKQRFMAPFGTPFLRPSTPAAIRALLDPGRLAEFGYFDPVRVQQLIEQIALWYGSSPPSGNPTSIQLQRLRLGIALTLVV